MDAHQPAFVLKDVSLLRSGRWILRDISWSAPVGSCCAILGPNGSGKSTLARILATHVFPSSGECAVLGARFGQTDLAALRRQIRLVQAAGPFDVEPTLSALETVLSGFFSTLALYDAPTEQMVESARRLLRQVGLERLAGQRYALLSSGERVRALIARAMAAQPKLLLLDEPTAGLDLLAREQVLATIESFFERDRPPLTAILITHHIEELPPATSEVLLLDDGKVAAAGAPADVLRSETLSKVYGCPLEVRQTNGRFWVQVNPQGWNELLK